MKDNETKYRTKDIVRLSWSDKGIEIENSQTIQTNSITLNQMQEIWIINW